jgi:hypothetical protein
VLDPAERFQLRRRLLNDPIRHTLRVNRSRTCRGEMKELSRVRQIMTDIPHRVHRRPGRLERELCTLLHGPECVQCMSPLGDVCANTVGADHAARLVPH